MSFEDARILVEARGRRSKQSVCSLSHVLQSLMVTRQREDTLPMDKSNAMNRGPVRGYQIPSGRERDRGVSSSGSAGRGKGWWS